MTVSTAQGENDSSTSATIQIVFAGPLDVEGDGGSKEKEPAMARRSVLNRSFSTSEKVLMLVLAVLLVVACYYFWW